MQAVRFGIFTTTNLKPINLATMLATHSFRTHVGVVFMMEDGSIVYFESLFSAGFTGPRPYPELLSWARSRPWHFLTVEWLPLAPELAHRKYTASLLMAKKKTPYAKNQLLENFGHEKFGWEVTTDPGRVTCSEAVAIIALPEIDLRDDHRKNCDSVTPGSLWKKLKEILAIEQRVNTKQRG